MFHVGDRVVYSIHGVCDIIGTEIKCVDRKQVTYLVLEPLGQPGSRYLVPTHNETAMGKLKPMLTREELRALLRSEAVRQDCWIREEGLRKQAYRELLGSGDREKLMSMIFTLYCHKAQQQASGRKIHLCDDNFLRDAEKLLAGEVAIVMELDFNAAKGYVRSCLCE